MKLVSLKRSTPVDPIWTNKDLVLYHGTLQKHVKSILRGIDIALCDDATDFGLGYRIRKLGVSNRGGNHWYDIVVGPVARRFQKRLAWGQYDQISFHTHKAARLLDNKVTMVSDWK